MAKKFCSVIHLPLKVLREQKVLIQRLQEEHFKFFKSIIGNDSTQNYSGFIILKAWDSVQSLKSKIIILLTPLDHTPSNLSTMLSVKIERELDKQSQPFQQTSSSTSDSWAMQTHVVVCVEFWVSSMLL